MNWNSEKLRHTMIFGSIAGGIVVFFQFILYFFGMLNTKVISSPWVIILLMGLFIFYVIKSYKTKIGESNLSFGSSFSLGFLSCIFAGVVIGIYNYILYAFLAPGLVEDILVQFQEGLIGQGKSDLEIEMASKLFESIMKPFVLGLLTVVSTAFWGALISLLVARLVSRNYNPLLNKKP